MPLPTTNRIMQYSGASMRSHLRRIAHGQFTMLVRAGPLEIHPYVTCQVLKLFLGLDLSSALIQSLALRMIDSWSKSWVRCGLNLYCEHVGNELPSMECSTGYTSIYTQPKTTRKLGYIFCHSSSHNRIVDNLLPASIENVLQEPAPLGKTMCKLCTAKRGDMQGAVYSALINVCTMCTCTTHNTAA